MVAPAKHLQVHGLEPERVALSDSSGTEGERSNNCQVFPDYSQLVPDRTQAIKSGVPKVFVPQRISPITYVMSSLGQNRLQDTRLPMPIIVRSQ